MAASKTTKSEATKSEATKSETAKVVLKAGDTFPAMALPDETGTKKKLGDLVGEKGLVLYVYPKDDTPGCTVEAQDFRDKVGAFGALGYRVAGLSKDGAASHCKFIEKYALTFPLLTDEGGEFLAAIGAYGEKNMYGKIVTGILRSTFVVDGKGKVVKAYANVKAKGHAEKVLADLTAMAGA